MLLAKESYYSREPPVEKLERNMHDIDDDDDDEETLSFCEFSMNSDADTWEDSSREAQNSSFKSSEGDDYFEFFSGELTTGTTISYAPPDNIIFCGKLISYKQPISENTKKMETIKPKKHKKRGIFRWKWNLTSSHQTKTSRKNSSNSTGAKKGSSQIVRGSCKSLPAPETSEQGRSVRRKRSKKHDLSVHKMSFFTPRRKSKWYLFLFGITKFRTDVELRDMKNRQSRRRSSSFSLFRLESEDSRNNESACMTRSKGFWTLLRALSCGGDHRATEVVKASIGGFANV